MPKTSIGIQKRSFTVSSAYHTDGCEAKFKNKDYSGIYLANEPASAAKKAGTQLCRVKKIRGQCSLYVEVRETTQGSSKKTFMYKLTRKKLDEPGPFGNEYMMVTKSVDSMTKKCKKSRASRGRKVSRTRKGKSYLK
jgi:hypothetical protein